MTYASSEVLDALQKANKLNETFWDLLAKRKDAFTGESRPSRDDVTAAANKVNNADVQLTDEIRQDLRRKPSEWADRGPVGFKEIRLTGPAELSLEPAPNGPSQPDREGQT